MVSVSPIRQMGQVGKRADMFAEPPYCLVVSLDPSTSQDSCYSCRFLHGCPRGQLSSKLNPSSPLLDECQIPRLATSNLGPLQYAVHRSASSVPEVTSSQRLRREPRMQVALSALSPGFVRAKTDAEQRTAAPPRSSAQAARCSACGNCSRGTPAPVSECFTSR